MLQKNTTQKNVVIILILLSVALMSSKNKLPKQKQKCPPTYHYDYVIKENGHYFAGTGEIIPICKLSKIRIGNVYMDYKLPGNYIKINDTEYGYVYRCITDSGEFKTLLYIYKFTDQSKPIEVELEHANNKTRLFKNN